MDDESGMHKLYSIANVNYFPSVCSYSYYATAYTGVCSMAHSAPSAPPSLSSVLDKYNLLSIFKAADN